MTDEILDLMKERQTISMRDSKEYKDANKIIKKKCAEAKDECKLQRYRESQKQE